MTSLHPIQRFVWRLLLRVAAGLVMLAVLTLAHSWWRDPAPAGADGVRMTADPVRVGMPVVYRVRVRCPYYRLPRVPPAVQPPEGAQVPSFARRRLARLGPRDWTWDCLVLLQPYRPGAIGSGTAVVGFSPGRREADESVRVALPGFEVKPQLAPGVHPVRVAGPVPASWLGARMRWWHWLGLALLVGLIGLALVSLFRRRRGADGATEPLAPPWTLAGQALDALAGRLPLAAEAFFVALTDIVRAYCEARFDMRATEATTPEFLAAMGRDERLTPEQRSRLAEVLRVADEVKFARGDASAEQMRAALETARGFVAQTLPAPPPPQRR